MAFLWLQQDVKRSDLTLPEWILASTEQRDEWLRDRIVLDPVSCEVLAESLIRRSRGDWVSDEEMLRIYTARRYSAWRDK